jgi:hypothetical protein
MVSSSTSDAISETSGVFKKGIIRKELDKCSDGREGGCGMNKLVSEARALCEGATEGPWETLLSAGKYWIKTPRYGVRDFCCLTGGLEHEADAALIAHSRTLLPEMADEIERLETRLDMMIAEFDRSPEGFWQEQAASAVSDMYLVARNTSAGPCALCLVCAHTNKKADEEPCSECTVRSFGGTRSRFGWRGKQKEDSNG